MTEPKTPPAWAETGIAKLLVKWNADNSQPSPSAFGHVALTSAIITAASILYASSVVYIKHLSEEWNVCPPDQPSPSVVVSGNTSAETNPKAIIKSTGTAGMPTRADQSLSTTQPDVSQVIAAINRLSGDSSFDQRQRLTSQLIQFSQAQRSACKIGVFFFSNRNATLTVCTAAGILSITSLALISRNGWDKTNNTFINIGLTSGLILFTSWTFSQLYGQGANYENQKAKTILATDMLNRIASATASGSDASMVSARDTNGAIKPSKIDLNKSEDMASLIKFLDDQLAILTNLDFSVDSSFAESSAKRFGDLLNNSTKPNTAPASNTHLERAVN